MDNDFTIGETRFKVSKINALKQFQIARRIAPILTEILPAMAKLPLEKDMAGMSESEKLAQFAAIGTPLMAGLCRLSDEDSNHVLLGLLGAVEMQQGANGPWSRVSRDGVLMFDNLELSVLLQAAGRAFMYNMAGFFAALPRVSS